MQILLERQAVRPHHVISRAVRVVRYFPRILALLAIGLLLMGAFYFVQARGSLTGRGLDQKTAAPVQSPPPALTVTVQKAGYAPMSRDIEATGTIAAIDPLSIGSEVSGLRIDVVTVDQGSFVKRGQVLAVLNSSVLRAQLEAAHGRLAEAQAAITRAVQPNRPQSIAAQQALVTQAEATARAQRAALVLAQATAANDEANAARYRELLSQGFATVQEAQNAETTAARARATVAAEQQRVAAADQAVQAARARLSELASGGAPHDVRIAQAQAQQAVASIHQLEAQLEQTVIRAPDAGLILKRDAHIGDITAPGKTLFTMVRQGQLELDAQVPETDLVKVKPGAGVTVRTQAGTVQGRVFQIAPSIDPQTRLGIVRIYVPAKPGIRAGMFAHAILHLGTAKALVVPTAAVQGTEGRRFTFVLESGRAKRRNVKVGQATGKSTQILSGLAPGDPVIVAGAGFLNDGDPVEVR